MTQRLIIVGLVLTCLLTVGCDRSASNQASSKTNAPPAIDRKLVIAVIPKGMTHEFWKSVEAGANQAGEENGVEILWKGPTTEGDRKEQIDIVLSMIARGVDGIVLAPLDSRALIEPVAQAKAAGIPVVIIDSALEGDEANYLSFVATDNLTGGQMAGQYMANLLQTSDNKQIAMLRYQEGHASTGHREKGFLQAAAQSNLKVIRDNVRGGDTAVTALQAAENMLTGLVDDQDLPTIAGVFAPNESTTVGLLKAIDRMGLAGTVRFVGFDASKVLIDALRGGRIDALVVQNPRKMGYTGVKTLLDARAGRKVSRRIDTGVMLVTRENLGTPEVRQLLGNKP